MPQASVRSGSIVLEYELRIIVEKAAISTQDVVKRNTIKVYDIKAPESILEVGLRHEEQISLLEGSPPDVRIELVYSSRIKNVTANLPKL